MASRAGAGRLERRRIHSMLAQDGKQDGVQDAAHDGTTLHRGRACVTAVR